MSDGEHIHDDGDAHVHDHDDLWSCIHDLNKRVSELEQQVKRPVVRVTLPDFIEIGGAA